MRVPAGWVPGALATLALLAGCAVGPNPDLAPVPPPPQEPARLALAGTRWLWLEAVVPEGGGSPPPQQTYWIQFEGPQRASLRVDCNRGFAVIRVRNGALTFPRIALTRRFCGEQSLDDRFMRMLEEVDAAYVENDRLRLGVARGGGTLDFVRIWPMPYVCAGEGQFVVWAIAGSRDLLFERADQQTRLAAVARAAPKARPEANGAGGASLQDGPSRYEGDGLKLEIDGRAASLRGPGIAFDRCRLTPTVAF